jgi:hypothetical protein
LQKKQEGMLQPTIPVALRPSNTSHRLYAQCSNLADLPTQLTQVRSNERLNSIFTPRLCSDALH